MFHGWWIVLTVFTVQLCMVGFMSYGYGLLIVEVEKEFACGMEKMNAGAIAMTALGFVLPLVVGPLVDRWSVRGLMLIGITGLVAGLLALSFAPSWVAWAVVMGSVVSMANTMLGPIVGQAAVSRWFTRSRGRAMGIAALGTSIGGIVMAPLFGLGFETIGWRMTIRVMAGLVALFAFPLLLLVFRNHPQDLGLLPEGVEAGSAAASAPPVRPAEAGEILRRLPFWAISICLALFLGTYNAMLMNVPKFAADLGADSMVRSSMIVALTVAGLVGKLLFGWLADRIPLNLGLWSAIGMTAAAIAVMATEPEIPVLVASAALMGLAAGGILPVWGALMAQIFGVANFGRAMGFQAPFITAGALAGLAIVGRIRDQTGSYVLAFQIFVGVLAVAAAVLVLLRMPEKAEAGVASARA